MISAAPARSPARWRPSAAAASSVWVRFRSRSPAMAAFSACQWARMSSRSAPTVASSASRAASRSFEAASDSLASAIRSISNWRTRRWATSTSVGIESTSMRSMLAASSTRSMALSGRNRSDT